MHALMRHSKLLSRRCCGGPMLAMSLLCVGLGLMFVLLSAINLGLVFIVVGMSSEALCFLMSRSRCQTMPTHQRMPG